MKRTLYRNIAVLDARYVTEETAQNIYEIENVAMLLVSEASQRALAGVAKKDIASVYVVPDEREAKLTCVNGQGTLAGGEEKTPMFLIVNGQIDVEEAMTAEEISRIVLGGVINGQIVASESQIQALYACGLQINGQAKTYPAGFTMRRGSAPLTRTEVSAWKEGAQVYMKKAVRVEEGALEEARCRGVKLAGKLIVDEEDAALLREVYEGKAGECRFVPRGVRICEKTLCVNARNARTLRGRIWALDGVRMEQHVTAEMLSGVAEWNVRGSLVVPAGLVGALLDRVNEDAEWMPYEGKLIYNGSELTLDGGMLDEAMTIYNKGCVELREDITPQQIREYVKLIYNDGVITGTAEQVAALRRVEGGGSGEMDEAKNETEEEASEAPETLPEDVVVVGNVSNLTI